MRFSLSALKNDMSKKSPKIAELISARQGQEFDAHYLGYFDCFNTGLYYEAHDVLEELWLKEGKSGVNYAFYKGLIQLAGAFVHLQKDRFGPAIALFHLAETNFRRYPRSYEGFAVDVGLGLIEDWRNGIQLNAPIPNPLRTRNPPSLPLPRR